MAMESIQISGSGMRIITSTGSTVRHFMRYSFAYSSGWHTCG
ncbi:hypothetical protein KYC5002_33975 [Archangium violaceum]|nr:hypothetical protein KYC5002_33975 [Archangium gephyra]